METFPFWWLFSSSPLEERKLFFAPHFHVKIDWVGNLKVGIARQEIALTMCTENIVLRSWRENGMGKKRKSPDNNRRGEEPTSLENGIDLKLEIELKFWATEMEEEEEDNNETRRFLFFDAWAGWSLLSTLSNKFLRRRRRPTKKNYRPFLSFFLSLSLFPKTFGAAKLFFPYPTFRQELRVSHIASRGGCLQLYVPMQRVSECTFLSLFFPNFPLKPRVSFWKELNELKFFLLSLSLSPEKPVRELSCLFVSVLF